MATRRSRPDPLAKSAAPRWMVAGECLVGPDGRMLFDEVVELQPGTDLKEHLRRMMVYFESEGWEMESEGKWAQVYMRKDGKRRYIHILHVDPRKPAVHTPWQPTNVYGRH